jgi:hypothetical protein
MKKILCCCLPAIVLAFGLIGCNNGNGGTIPVVVTYEGAINGETWILKITDSSSFELTIDDKTSAGTATKNGDVWILSPDSEGSFTVTVNSSGIDAITGTIVFTDGTTKEGPGTFAPPNDGEPALTINNVAGNTKVRITTQTISSGVNFDTLTGVVATGQGSYPYLTWTGTTLTGTFNVMLRLVNSPNTVKFQNGAQFTNGSATVDWNTMTGISGDEERPALTINNAAGNTTVKITTQTISSGVDFDTLTGVVATGQGSYPYLAWTGTTLTGTFNVMLRLVDSPNTVKFQNGAQFTNGSATVDWNTMTE